MNAFDQLPARARASLNRAPGKFSAVQLLDMLREGYDLDHLLTVIVNFRQGSA